MNEDSNLPPQQAEPPAIDVDELRNSIWDYLFNNKSAHRHEEIAQLAGCDVETVRTATNHEWFRVQGDLVSLAYVGGN